MNSSPDGCYFDISRPLSEATAGWPGDEPFAYSLSWEMARGASVNVGKISTSVHTATHCDAPFHFAPGGRTVEQLPVELFWGPAWVVDVRGRARWQDALEALDWGGTPRVLFHTGGWPDHRQFPAGIPVMEPTLPAWLAGRGVRLVGLDLPSVDALDSKTLDRHHQLAAANITIVEGLRLDHVPAGRYEFVGLPLPIVGGDGAPLRAALRTLSAAR